MLFAGEKKANIICDFYLLYEIANKHEEDIKIKKNVIDITKKILRYRSEILLPKGSLQGFSSIKKVPIRLVNSSTFSPSWQ